MIDLRKEEARAASRYDRALCDAYERLKKGESVSRAMEKAEPLRIELEQKRFELMVEERDENMLRRGTKRGMLIVVGIALLLSSAWVLNEAFTANYDESFPVLEDGLDPEEVRVDIFVFGVSLVLCAGASLLAARRLGRVPLLGKEND